MFSLLWAFLCAVNQVWLRPWCCLWKYIEYVSIPISTTLVQVFDPECCNSLKTSKNCQKESSNVFKRILWASSVCSKNARVAAWRLFGSCLKILKVKTWKSQTVSNLYPVSCLANINSRFLHYQWEPWFVMNLVKFLTKHLLPQTYRWSNTIVLADLIPSNLICEIFCFPDRVVATPCIPLPSSCLDHICEAWSHSSRFVLWSKHEDKRQCAEETSLLALPSSCISPRCLPHIPALWQ